MQIFVAHLREFIWRGIWSCASVYTSKIPPFSKIEFVFRSTRAVSLSYSVHSELHKRMYSMSDGRCVSKGNSVRVIFVITWKAGGLTPQCANVLSPR
jgi:hypothetical protein